MCDTLHISRDGVSGLNANYAWFLVTRFQSVCVEICLLRADSKSRLETLSKPHILDVVVFFVEYDSIKASKHYLQIVLVLFFLTISIKASKPCYTIAMETQKKEL